jgi:hypothetical protein
MHVKLYEDIARNGHIATTYAYPVKVEGPLRDGPVADAEIRQSEDAHVRRAAAVRRGPGKAHLRDAAAHRCGQPRFRGPPRSRSSIRASPARCAAPSVYLDEVILDDKGGRMFVCSDTDYCESRRPKDTVGHRSGASLTQVPEEADGQADTLDERAAAGMPRRSSRLLSGGYDPGLRQPDRLRRCQFRPVAGRGAGDRRRIRFRQDHAAQLHFDAADADLPARSATGCAMGKRDSTRWARPSGVYLMRTDWGFVHQNPPTACA